VTVPGLYAAGHDPLFDRALLMHRYAELQGTARTLRGVVAPRPATPRNRG
jgi:hypothetical protein